MNGNAVPCGKPPHGAAWSYLAPKLLSHHLLPHTYCTVYTYVLQMLNSCHIQCQQQDLPHSRCGCTVLSLGRFRFYMTHSINCFWYIQNCFAQVKNKSSSSSLRYTIISKPKVLTISRGIFLSQQCSGRLILYGTRANCGEKKKNYSCKGKHLHCSGMLSGWRWVKIQLSYWYLAPWQFR